MNCREAHEYLFAFLDSELDAHLSMEMQRHLEQCPRCAQEAEIERTTRRQLTQAMGIAASSPGTQAVADLDEVVSRVTAWKPRAAFWTARRIVLGSTGLAAMIIMAVFVIQAFEHQPHASNQLVDLLVADFSHFVEKGKPLQIASSEPLEVSEWLADQTALPVQLPFVSTEQGKLLGARKCKLNGKPAAFTAYDLGDATASLVILPGTHQDVEGMEQVEHDGHTHWVDRCKGHTVVACRRGALVYAAVSTLPEDRLLPLMASAEN